MLDAGVAREVARIVPPLNLYSSVLAGTMEHLWIVLTPLTHVAFVEHGRVAPRSI